MSRPRRSREPVEEQAMQPLAVAADALDPSVMESRLLHGDRMAALCTLSAGVAHQINNPLTYVLINVEYVLRRLRSVAASDDPAAELALDPRDGLSAMFEALEHAVEGANRIRAVVGDLRTFAGGNADRFGIVDVRAILESAIQLAWYEIHHRARLSRMLSEVPPVEANEARLAQVFLGLLTNAAHAIGERRADHHELSVSTYTDDRGNAVVEVSDTGGGIAPEHLSRIFEPFFTTKGSASAGMGLAIAHGIVAALGGEITVASTPGVGTTFRVVLRPAEHWRSGARASAIELRPFVAKRVLVVDDDRKVGEAVARAFWTDHAVEIITEPDTALDRLGSAEPYDVILCELMMPNVTGMQLHAEVMNRDPRLARRFVFMSRGAFCPRARAFLETVSNPCLDKPLDMRRLRSVVTRVKDAL